MQTYEPLPTAVLICHERDRIDREALASWLANALQLAGFIIIRDRPGRLWRAARRELRRVGPLRFLDVLAFRLYNRLRLAPRDTAWIDRTVDQFRARYPADLMRVPQIVVSSPNSDEARAFLARLTPDVVIARCKVMLTPAIFQLPRVGTFVLHPGICPEYRNAHGCFWALANRDVGRVGMTLLRADAGVDTGPVYLQAGSGFDESRESHTMIQYRVVLDNLETVGAILRALCRGEHVPPLDTSGRRSAVWGQPQLTAYLRWKRTARQEVQPRDAHGVAALP